MTMARPRNPEGEQTMSKLYVEITHDNGEREICEAAEWLFTSELTAEERGEYDRGHNDGVSGTLSKFASPAYMDGWIDAQPYE